MTAFFESISHVQHLGHVLSVISAVAWAAAVILFRVSGRSVHPLSLNLFKNAAALVFTLLAAAAVGNALLPDLGWRTYGLFMLSGLLGIAISDTFFFASLNRLGAGLVAVVDCLYSPFIISFSFFFLGERMSASQLLGVALIISAVLTVSLKNDSGSLARKDLCIGVAYGILAMFFVAVGIVMIKPSLPAVPLLWATMIRLAGGTIGLALTVAVHPRRAVILRPLFSLQNWKAMVPASFLGGFISLIFWLGGMKYALASVAAALNQLSTIFIFMLAAVFLDEKASFRRVVAVAAAFAGAFLASAPV
ncbi:MAG: DMT family transporter [Acidobacteriota bacterium]|nr:DMT family transporter [Acidobacteriota bacterium]